MPTYDYQCEKCNTVFEEVRHISDRKNVVCPSCGSDKIRQVFITAPMIFGDMQPHYNRGMGCHVTGKKDYERKKKEKGLVEMGDSCYEKEWKETLAEHAERKRNQGNRA